MDPIVQVISTVLFGGGGLVGLFSMWQSHRARKRGAPTTEAAAAVPPWEVLTRHYQEELDSLRGDLREELEDVRRKVARLERLREVDSSYISLLETWIWSRNPPPPPPRPAYPAE